MKRRYKFVKIPMEAYDGFYKKKQVLENIVKKEMKKDKRVSYADTLRFFSQKPVFVYNEEFIKFYKKQRPKRTKGGFII